MQIVVVVQTPVSRRWGRKRPSETINKTYEVEVPPGHRFRGCSSDISGKFAGVSMEFVDSQDPKKTHPWNQTLEVKSGDVGVLKIKTPTGSILHKFIVREI